MGSKKGFPSVSHLLHFGPGLGYVCDGKEVVNGIPTHRYKANYGIEGLDAILNIDYYWSGMLE